jgi:hypothetical protein
VVKTLSLVVQLDGHNQLTTLIPTQEYEQFVKQGYHLDKIKLREFADKMDINIGILIGRLMKDKHIDFSKKSYEALRRKFNI